MMAGDMGSFRTDIGLENPARPGKRRSVTAMLVDTGSELSWVPADVGQSRLRTSRRSVAAGSKDTRRSERGCGPSEPAFGGCGRDAGCGCLTPVHQCIKLAPCVSRSTLLRVHMTVAADHSVAAARNTLATFEADAARNFAESYFRCPPCPRYSVSVGNHARLPHLLIGLSTWHHHA